MSTNLNATATAETTRRFSLGQLFITQGASEALEESGQSAQEFINRHSRLERGELCEEDHKENLFSLNKALRIFSAFKTANGVKIWIVTEADRSATTALLPSEY